MKNVLAAIVIASFFALGPKIAAIQRAQQLASQAADQVADHCESDLTTDACHQLHPTGCTNAQSARYDPYLNFLKNQQPPRTLSPDRVLEPQDFMNLEDNTPPGIGPVHHADFADTLANIDGVGEGNIYAVIGYLYFVENTELTSRHRGETCNCQLQAPGSFDFHLGIGFDSAVAAQVRKHLISHDPQHPGVLEQTSIVAEMTPHTRPSEWTVARLNRQRGKQIKVIGQLTLDNVHLNDRDDCSFTDEAGGTCWRASAWELHPVLQFLVCKTGNTCSKNSPDSDWDRLEDLP